MKTKLWTDETGNHQIEFDELPSLEYMTELANINEKYIGKSQFTLKPMTSVQETLDTDLYSFVSLFAVQAGLNTADFRKLMKYYGDVYAAGDFNRK